MLCTIGSRVLTASFMYSYTVASHLYILAVTSEPVFYVILSVKDR